MSKERPNHLVFKKDQYRGIETFRVEFDEIFEDKLQLNILNIIVSEDIYENVRFDVSYFRNESLRKWSFDYTNILEGLDFINRLYGIDKGLRRALSFILKFTMREVTDGINLHVSDTHRKYKFNYEEKVMDMMSSDLFTYTEFNDALIFNYKDTSVQSDVTTQCMLTEDYSALIIVLYDEDNKKQIFDLTSYKIHGNESTYEYSITDILLYVDKICKGNMEKKRLIESLIVKFYSQLV